MSEYLQFYLDETEEELEGLTAALLVLEDEPEDAEALNEAFRLTHSIKGTAGMMGYTRINEAAHRLEDLLSAVRAGERRLDRDLMDLCLRAVDYFRAHLAALGSGESEGPEPGDLVAALAAAQGVPFAPLQGDGSEAAPAEGSPPAPPEPAAPEPAAPEPAAASPPPASPVPSAAAAAADAGTWEVRARFEDGLPLRDLKARVLLTRLGEAGEILASEPTRDQLESGADPAEVRLSLLSDLERDDIVRLARIDGVAAAEVVPATAAESVSPTPALPGENSLPQPPPANLSVESGPAESAAAAAGAAAAVRGHPGETAASPPAASQPPAVPPSPPDAAEPVRRPAAATVTRVASETVRVDIGRLDRLMNLTGELVVNRARLEQLSFSLRPAFRKKAWGEDARDRGELTRGMTVADRRPAPADPPSVDVAVAVDAERFKNAFLDALLAWARGNGG